MKALAGIFETRDDAHEAVDRLKAAGFDPGEIGMVLREKAEDSELALHQRALHRRGGPHGGVMVTVCVEGGREVLAEDELRQAGAERIEEVDYLVPPETGRLIPATSPWAGGLEPR